MGRARWAGFGFPQVVLGHKLAASLLATRVDPEALELVCQPWAAYRIVVPHSLISVPDPLVPGGVMIVDSLAVFDAGPFVHITAASRSSEFSFFVGHRTVARGLLEDDGTTEEGDLSNRAVAPVGSVHKRALGLLWRLMVGVALEMSDPRRMKEPRPRRDVPEPGEVPVVRTYVHHREVTVDCRQVVQDYMTGIRHASPRVQVLVRGHWKRQAIGSGRQERRWIQIEPYWRGPEDAPPPDPRASTPGWTEVSAPKTIRPGPPGISRNGERRQTGAARANADAQRD